MVVAGTMVEMAVKVPKSGWKRWLPQYSACRKSLKTQVCTPSTRVKTNVVACICSTGAGGAEMGGCTELTGVPV